MHHDSARFTPYPATLSASRRTKRIQRSVMRMTTRDQNHAHERPINTAAPQAAGLTQSVNAAIDEIRACLDERGQSPVSLARRRLAAHHAAARLRRNLGREAQA